MPTSVNYMPKNLPDKLAKSYTNNPNNLETVKTGLPAWFSLFSAKPLEQNNNTITAYEKSKNTGQIYNLTKGGKRKTRKQSKKRRQTRRK